ncbi:MAG TPA: hypothetical protein VN923_16705, partial [Thermoanaerobaculia bacterium]|nr:hypothetical protein [Thermoanaerobaculia bacterium]
MAKELRIDFRGLVAFVPDRKFAAKPTAVLAVLRDLSTAKLIKDENGKEQLVDAHTAWLEFSPGDYVQGPGEVPGIFKVTRANGAERAALLLRQHQVSILPDGNALPVGIVDVGDDVLAHLAVFKGTLKQDFQPGQKDVAAAWPLSGGRLSLGDKTTRPFEVPLHNGNLAIGPVAVSLRWS